MPNDSPRPDVAVFIDFENVYVSVRDKLDANPNFEMIMDRCEDFGRVVIARAYADWYRYPRVTSALYANGIEPMYVPTYYYDRELGRTGRAIKNSVDMNLCIDAMKTLYTNTNIAKFVLATGDRDFIPLVNTIRQQGKEVIIIGIGGAASAHLAQSADEFIFYESLVGKKASDLTPDLPRAKMPEKGREYAEADEEEVAPPPAIQPRSREREPQREPQREQETPRVEAAEQSDIYDTLVSAINLARERGYVCSFGSLKLLMKELMGGDFKEAKYKDASGRPFAKFKDFVLEAERRGKVQVFTRGTVNEVFLPGEDPFKLSQFAQEIKEEPGIPVIPAAEIDTRPESRASVISNGRRRRRRSRGGQRPGTPALDGTLPLDEPDEDEELELPELILPDLSLDEQFDQAFEAPLEIVETPANIIDTSLLEPAEEIAAIEPLDQAETIAQAAEPAQPAAEPATGDEEAQPSGQPFAEAEWQLLHDVVERFERPVSFAQIHDALRNARNSAGINRTNEELRSLIKQAINTGTLERIGKGNRASYRLAQLVEATGQGEYAVQPSIDQPEGEVSQPASDRLPSAPHDLVVPNIAAADQTAMIEAVAAPSSGGSRAGGGAGQAPAKRSRPRRKPAAEAPAEITPEPVAESAPAPASEPPKKPARTSRKKAAPAQAQTAEAPAAEAPAQVRRSRRKKTESAE
jgi:uncharacterized protein (TIGR00288 family)